VTIQLISLGLAATAEMTRSSFHWCSVASRQQLSNETVGTRGLSVRKARTGRVKCVDGPYGLIVVSKGLFQSFCEELLYLAGSKSVRNQSKRFLNIIRTPPILLC